ncbi:MAG: hypothetical protein ACOYOP_16485 [Microthrixaceae bacterium]
MLFEPTLAELTSFVTVSRLTEATGLSRGAASRAFAAELAARPDLTAPEAVARSAFLDPPGGQEVVVEETATLFEAVLADAARGPLPLPEVVAHLIAGPVAVGAVGVDRSGAQELTRDWLALAVCPDDAEVREELVRRYRQNQQVFGALLDRLLGALDREPVVGTDVEELAAVLQACIDGLAGRLRREPELGEEFVVRTLIALWSGLTQPAGADGDDVHIRAGAGGRPHSLGPGEDAAVVAAVRELYAMHGWSSLTLDGVADRSSVPVGRLVRSRPDRRHFAPIVWEALAERLERTLSGPRPDRTAALAALACRHRAAAAAMVELRMAVADDPSSHAAREVGRMIDRLGALLDDAVGPESATVAGGTAAETVLALAASPAGVPPAVVAAAARAVAP